MCLLQGEMNLFYVFTKAYFTIELVLEGYMRLPTTRFPILSPNRRFQPKSADKDINWYLEQRQIGIFSSNYPFLLTDFELNFSICRFVSDTCSTLKDFKENPENHGIANMLPCPKMADTEKKLRQIGHFIHSVVNEVTYELLCTALCQQFHILHVLICFYFYLMHVQMNSKVSELRQIFSTSKLFSDNQSVLDVCDPFGSAPNYTYSPGNCRADSIQVGDLPSVGHSLHNLKMILHQAQALKHLKH